MSDLIKTYKQLRVYQNAIQGSMDIFHLTKHFPREETYSLTDQIRRSSRSVCANLAEAWRKRRYQAAFIAKLNDVESEASETQVWIELACRCGYLEVDKANELDTFYNQILAQLILMIKDPNKWLIR